MVENTQVMKKTPRPKSVPSESPRVDTACGHLYVHLTFLDDKLFEVFASLGKAGGCATAYSQALTRCITLGLRYGVPPEDYVRQLQGISCPGRTIDDGVTILSCPDAIAKVIKQRLKLDVPEELNHHGSKQPPYER